MSPAPHVGGDLRISHENVNAMFRVFLIFAFRFEDEFLEYIITTSNHAVYLGQ